MDSSIFEELVDSSRFDQLLSKIDWWAIAVQSAVCHQLLCKTIRASPLD